jgi:Skp family chaperone for outer membrane proteins
MATVSGAESWSKDRIKEEIRKREREIAQIRDNIEEREAEYERDGYDNAPSGWSFRLYDEISDLEGEITYLNSLL